MSNAINIKNLSKTFRVGFWGRKVEAVRDLTLEVGKNEIFGFLGPNGAGKTTTIKMILELIYPTTGKIELLGEPNTSYKIRSRIGFLPENPYFYDYLTADEFLVFYGQLCNLNRSERKKKVPELLKTVGLKNVENIQLRKFSKGMLQRIGLAQALINDPELVILDEPMSGLDPIGRKEIRDVILRLKEEGKTVFFSSHILPDVEMICDRVGIIYKGALKAVGTLSEIMGSALKSVEITARGIDNTEKLTGPGVKVSKRGEIVHIVLDGEEINNETIQKVISLGGKIIEVFPKRQSLEDYFMETVDEKKIGIDGAKQ